LAHLQAALSLQQAQALVLAHSHLVQSLSHLQVALFTQPHLQFASGAIGHQLGQQLHPLNINAHATLTTAIKHINDFFIISLLI
jgi:hypothetical protein